MYFNSNRIASEYEIGEYLIDSKFNDNVWIKIQ